MFIGIAIFAKFFLESVNYMGVRKHNRCQITGRPRGYMRQFGISRVTFREMAVAGKIPGITKASW